MKRPRMKHLVFGLVAALALSATGALATLSVSLSTTNLSLDGKPTSFTPSPFSLPSPCSSGSLPRLKSSGAACPLPKKPRQARRQRDKKRVPADFVCRYSFAFYFSAQRPAFSR